MQLLIENSTENTFVLQRNPRCYLVLLSFKSLLTAIGCYHLWINQLYILLIAFMILETFLDFYLIFKYKDPSSILVINDQGIRFRHYFIDWKNIRALEICWLDAHEGQCVGVLPSNSIQALKSIKGVIKKLLVKKRFNDTGHIMTFGLFTSQERITQIIQNFSNVPISTSNKVMYYRTWF